MPGLGAVINTQFLSTSWEVEVAVATVGGAELHLLVLRAATRIAYRSMAKQTNVRTSEHELRAPARANAGKSAESLLRMDSSDSLS